MAGLDPLLSGTSVAYREAELGQRDCWPWRLDVAGVEQVRDRAAHEQMSAHDQQDRAGGVERGLGLLDQPNQQIGDEGDGDLAANGIVAAAEKACDLEVLLDPFEEQLDLPALLVEFCDLFGRAGQI